MNDLKFPSSQIAQEYLLHATPETVYAWLEANAHVVSFSSDESLVTIELLAVLLDRNEPLVTLGIASFTHEHEILRKLWQLDNERIRLAIAGNPYRDRGLLSFPRPHMWAGTEELTSALQNSHPDFIKLWCTNPALNYENLREVFSKEGIYKPLSEDIWLTAVYWALQNPNLTIPDGSEKSTYEAAWSLLLTLPNTRGHARLLCGLYPRLEHFLPPDMAAPKDRADYSTEREKWQQQRDERDVTFLGRVFERWAAAASDDPDAGDKEGKEAREFQFLRQDVSAAAARRNGSVQHFIKTHTDVYVRRGYYMGGRFASASEIEEAFQKDGKDFLEAAIYNDNLYASYPKGVRLAFARIASSQKAVEFRSYPEAQFGSIWDAQATKLFKKDPTRYPDPDDFDSFDDAEEGTSHAAAISRRLNHGSELFMDVCAELLIIGVAVWAAWGVKAWVKELVHENFLGRGLGVTTGAVAFVVTMIAILRMGNWLERMRNFPMKKT